MKTLAIAMFALLGVSGAAMAASCCTGAFCCAQAMPCCNE